jgi:tyrosine-protein phosphatase SIW14
VVDEGRLYRSAQPSTQQIQHLIDTRGLKTILIVRSGTSSRVPDEIGFAHGKGLHVVHIPIESQKPIPQEQIEAFFRCVDDPGNAPILVHCSAGRHRTGYLCARYRIDRQGWPLERAIDELLSFGFDTQDQSAVLEQLKQYRPAAIRTTALSAASPGVRDDP